MDVQIHPLAQQRRVGARRDIHAADRLPAGRYRQRNDHRSRRAARRHVQVHRRRVAGEARHVDLIEELLAVRGQHQAAEGRRRAVVRRRLLAAVR